MRQIPALFRHPPDAIGRRGASLLIYGLACLVYAASIVARVGAHPTDLFSVLPLPVHAGAWLVPGAIAIVCAFRRDPSQDRAGYVAVAAITTARAAAYGVAWVFSVLPVNAPSDRLGWAGAAFWALIAAKVITDAGWSEPCPDGKGGQ